MSLEEARAYFCNWRLPSIERLRHLKGDDVVKAAQEISEATMGRDEMKDAAAAASSK